MKVLIDPLKDIEILWAVDGEYLRPMYAVDNLRRIKTSKWEPAESRTNSPQVKCGNCGEVYFEYFKKFPYRPMCGTRMEDGNDNH